jgi:hypothetical protein
MTPKSLSVSARDPRGTPSAFAFNRGSGRRRAIGTANPT